MAVQADKQTDTKSVAAGMILAATFFYIASTMLVNPLITGFSGELGTGEALAGLLASLMSVCSLAMRPVGGNLSDRVSFRVLGSVGAGLMSVACVGYALAQTPVQLAVFRITNGIGYSLCSVCMSTWFASLLPPERIGSGMGTFGMMNALAMAVGPAFGVMMSQMFGYRLALACGAVFACASVALVQLAAQRASAPARTNVSAELSASGKASAHSAASELAAESTQIPTSRPVGQSATRHPLRILEVRALPAALIIMCFSAPYAAMQSYVVSYATAHNAGAYVSFFFPVYAAILLAMRYALRKQFDTVSFGRFIGLASLSALVEFVLFWKLNGPIGLFVAALFVAGSYGIMCSVCQANAVKSAGKDHAGLANGTYYMGFDVGMALGPICGGAVIETLGMDALFPALCLSVPLAIAVYLVTQKFSQRTS